MAEKWGNWPDNPCRLGGPQRLKAGGIIRRGPQLGGLATSCMPSGGSPTPPNGRKKSEVAHKWVDGLHNMCHLGGPQRF